MHSYLLASKLTAWSQKSFNCLSLSVALCTSNSEKSHRVFFSHIKKPVRRHFPHDWCWITAALCQGKVQMYHCVAGTDPKPISICPSRESVEHRGSAQPLLGGEVRKKLLQHHWNSWGNWAWRWFVEHNEFDKYCPSFFYFIIFFILSLNKWPVSPLWHLQLLLPRRFSGSGSCACTCCASHAGTSPVSVTQFRVFILPQ